MKGIILDLGNCADISEAFEQISDLEHQGIEIASVRLPKRLAYELLKSLYKTPQGRKIEIVMSNNSSFHGYRCEIYDNTEFRQCLQCEKVLIDPYNSQKFCDNDCRTIYYKQIRRKRYLEKKNG